jgi:hypothetical protein
VIGLTGHSPQRMNLHRKTKYFTKIAQAHYNDFWIKDKESKYDQRNRYRDAMG